MEKYFFSILTIFVFVQLNLTKSECVFNQNDSKSVNELVGEERKPFISKSDEDLKIICPNYVGKYVCCTKAQTITMKNNFNLLDITFSQKNDGCDICAVNLKRLYCDFTCSPNQSEFSK